MSMMDRLDALKDQVVAEFAGEDPEKVSQAKAAFEEVYRQVVRQRILIDGKRPDGRADQEIRPIWCEVGISPRAHGSGLFTRGETQVLTLATLGTPKEAQEMDTLSPTDSKRYIHHYNFPPYATGEVKMLRARPAAKSGTAPWPNALCCRSSPQKTSSPTPCAWSPKCCHPTVLPRWPRCAAQPWR